MFVKRSLFSKLSNILNRVYFLSWASMYTCVQDHHKLKSRFVYVSYHAVSHMSIGYTMSAGNGNVT